MRIVIMGLSITSSWGNGHAATYRGLVRELCARGHDVLFLERDAPWYAENRDLPSPPYGITELYTSFADLRDRFAQDIRRADLVIVGSYVSDGVAVGEWVTDIAGGITAFYDIDTPITLAKLDRGDDEYLSRHLVPRYNIYLSFTGGPTLQRMEKEFGSPMARPLYCSFDPDLYFPEDKEIKWDLGYLSTYSNDCQPLLDQLLILPARKWHTGRFVVAGLQYPKCITWPRNVGRVEHLPQTEHCDWYNSQRFTLNITRADMIHAGYSPSVQLLEAAACATPIISDWWPGLDTIFAPGTEILISESAEDVLYYLQEISEEERRAIGVRARKRVMAEHTAAHRAVELEEYASEVLIHTDC